MLVLALILVTIHQYYWREEEEKASRRAELLPNSSKERRKTFLDENYCVIDDEHFFVRGIIPLPIIGSAETFCWGVWGSLSRENFETLIRMDKDEERVELPPMFSWLSTQISEYPDTLNLKMYAQIQEPHWRPQFELEPSDHPLSREYHNGINAKRVREIMTGRLRESKELSKNLLPKRR